jgi:O-antigen/teichoic acid export membrane protein
MLTSASILQNLIVFASAPVVARLFDPAHFGIAGLIQALGVVPVLLASGQYYIAIGIARNRGESINLAFLSILLAAISAVLMLPVALYLQARPTLLPDQFQNVVPYLWTIPAFMIAGTCLFVTRLWEVRLAHYGPLVMNRLLESVVMAGAQISFGFIGAGPLGLIAGRWLGTAVAGLHGLYLLVRQIGRQGLRLIRLRRLRALARRHWQFPAYQLPAQAAGELTRQLSPILLGFFYSVTSVGFYWFANRLLERPAIVYGSNVGRVFYQHAADCRRSGRPVSRLYWRSTAALAATSVLPFGAVMLLGPMLFKWVFGPEWEEAGHFARWIALANLTFLIAFPARGATALFGLQKSYVVIETVRGGTSALTIVLIALAGGGELLAVGVAASAQSILTLGFILFAGFHLHQLDRRLAPHVPSARVT